MGVGIAAEGPVLMTAEAISPGNANGQVGVRLENPQDNGIGVLVNVICVGDQPEQYDRGIVLFEDGEDSDGYWLGSIDNRHRQVDDEKKVELPSGAKGLFNVKGTCGITVANSNISLAANNMSLSISNNAFQISKNNLSLQLGDDGFYVKIPDGENTAPSSSFTLRNSGVELLSGGSVVIRTNTNIDCMIPGDFTIVGIPDDSGERAFKAFKVKCQTALIDATGGFVDISSSGFNLKIGSSMLSNKNGVPGLGPSTACGIEVVQGDMDLSVGVGDISIRSLSPLSSVKMVNGLFFIGPQSWFEADVMSAVIGAEMAPGTGATITLNRTGSAEHRSLLGTSITSVVGDIDMNAAININLSPLMEFVLETMSATIKAQMMVEIETMVLDLTKSTQVDFGPSTTIPSSSGPLCSIPVCPILGCVHVGEKCVG